MKKSIKLMVVAVLAMTVVSCRGYEREQDRLDKESEGKGSLLKAESTKKVAIEQAKADLESAKLDSQTKITKAKASATAKIIAAKASAEAKLINANAEAKANQALNESITPEVLEYFKIQRWNGKLPTTVAGSGTNTIIGIK